MLNDGCVDLGNGGEVVLDVPLEHGMVITSFTFHYFDNDPGNMTFVLFEIDDLNGGRTTSGTLSDSQTASTGAVGYGKATVTPWCRQGLVDRALRGGCIHARQVQRRDRARLLRRHRQLGPPNDILSGPQSLGSRSK